LVRVRSDCIQELRLEEKGGNMRRTVVALVVAALGTLTLAVSSSAATATTCTDTLAPGTYGAVTVPAAATCIIMEGPITIRGGLSVGEGATFVFSSEETPDVTATISGGVVSSNALSVQIHFATINGGVSLQGGAGPFGGPFDVTWNTLEDNQINGAVTVNGYTGFWQGFIRNNVNGSVNFNNNTVLDPDGNEVVTNTIHGSLNCSGNTPAPQVGDSEGQPNVVTGPKTGQCTGL
jgi:5'-nucleotidase